MGYYVGGGGWLRKEDESDEGEGKKKNGNGNGNGSHSNGNGNGNGSSNGGSNGGGGGGVSEAWSAKYKKSIDCDNPKGFSQRAHCGGRKKVSEGTMSPSQKRKDTMLKKKYDKSDMKQNMIDQYGKEEGTKIYFATIRKQAMKEEKKGDHEISMAQSQLKKSERNIKKLRKALGTKERDIPAWVQAKITDTEHNTDAAAGYMEEGKRDGKSAKSKGYSLRDWFKGGGWVQAGGKYDGKPCAKQPGQKTKPFCRDADDRANMSKKERSRRAAKKRREDPNPNRKGKAKMVSASYSNWRNELQLNEGMGLGIAAGAAALAAAPYLAKKFLKPKADKALQRGRKELHLKGNPIGAGARGLGEGSAFGGGQLRPYDNVRNLKGELINLNQIDAKIRAKQVNNKKGVKEEYVEEGKKDACYYKVKSRYSVWPSAYASGALVKCRKVGAKNWGNKTKKEGYEFSNWRDDFQATEYESVDIIKAEPLKPTDGIGSRMLGEAKKCWKGYKKVGTQKLFGKTYNRCEKIKEGAAIAGLGAGLATGALLRVLNKKGGPTIDQKNAQDARKHLDNFRKKQKNEEVEIQEAIPGYDKYNDAVAAAKNLTGRKKIEALKAAAKLRPATEKEVNQKLGEDWQKSNRNDGVDGMSQKSVDAYRRENPGSKLKTAVTGKVKKGSKDSKRRKSFCARSDGQRKMHNIDCKKTPDKKICKARRRWKC